MKRKRLTMAAVRRAVIAAAEYHNLDVRIVAAEWLDPRGPSRDREGRRYRCAAVTVEAGGRRARKIATVDDCGGYLVR